MVKTVGRFIDPNEINKIAFVSRLTQLPDYIASSVMHFKMHKQSIEISSFDPIQFIRFNAKITTNNG